MRSDRLLKLAAYLDTLPPEKFDLSTWHCGTTGCAVGHACTMPEFRAEGLRLSEPVDAFDDSLSYYPTYDGLDHWHAVCAFFELTKPESTYLFDMYEYSRFEGDECTFDGGDAPPDMVAARIREVCASS